MTVETGMSRREDSLRTGAFRIAFDALVILIFAAVLIVSLKYKELASYAPLVVGGLGLLLSVGILAMDMRNHISRENDLTPYAFYEDMGDVQEKADSVSVAIPTASRLWGGLRYMAWYCSYALLIYVVGIYVATALFLGLFLIIEDGSWRAALVGLASGILVISILGSALALEWPESLLLTGK